MPGVPQGVDGHDARGKTGEWWVSFDELMQLA